MATFKCKRRCYDFGRVWEEGEVLELDSIPSKHFEYVEGDLPAIAPISTAVDSMRPTPSGQASTFSEMAAQNSPLKGFASSLNKTESNPLTKTATVVKRQYRKAEK